MSNLAAAPVAALVFVGLVFAALGLFGGSLEVIVLGVGSLVAAGVIGALANRRA